MLKLAEDLKLPLDVVTEKLAWLGRTGSGKTYGAMKMAELMLGAGAQVGALDPIGVWRALRVPAEKGGTSFEVVVFGGLYGDLPLEPTESAGHLVADLVCERGLSFVLDVSQFIPAEQQRFVRAFADRFFHRKKSAPSAVHLFMEECQEFIPENPSGEEAKTLGVMQRLWKLGRNFGIGGSLISQRPQEIAKKALNMSGTLFAFQMTGPQERKAVKLWVADKGIAVDIESVLQKLDIGQPHVESPMFLEVSKTVRILPRVTADLSSTPKVGASTAAKRPLTPIDVELLKTSMAATIEKAKADDPRELRKQLAAARAELAAKEKVLAEVDARTKRIDEKLQRAGATKRDTERAGKIAELKAELIKYRRALEEAVKILVKVKAVDFSARGGAALEEAVTAAVKQITGGIEKRVSALAERVQGIQAAASAAETAIQKLLDEKIDLTVTVQKQAPFTVTAPTKERPAVKLRQAATGDGSVTPVMRRILDALAELEQLGAREPARELVAFLAGYSHLQSKGFVNGIGALRSGGLLDYPAGGTVTLTDAGRGVAQYPDAPRTPNEVQDRVIGLLGGASGRILKPLIDAYPNALPREEVARLANYGHLQSKGFVNAIGRLRTLGFIDYPDRGTVRAQPVLFLEA